MSRLRPDGGTTRSAGAAAGSARAPRADAQRNLDALLAAAEAEFAVHGVGAPVRAIAARAGVGTATLYRHFPRRSDLVTAVFRREVDACAERADALAATQEPERALASWIDEYRRFIAAKRGLATALNSDDPALAALPGYFQDRLGPALAMLLDAAAATGAIRGDIDPIDLLSGIAKLSVPPTGIADASRGERVIALVLDGLRYGARITPDDRFPRWHGGSARPRSPAG